MTGDRPEPNDVDLSPTVAALYMEYATAREAKRKWAKYEQETKADLYAHLGYDDADPKPQPIQAIAPNGETLFRVCVSHRKGFDIEYLKKMYPDVYAECEKSTPVKTIRAVASDGT